MLKTVGCSHTAAAPSGLFGVFLETENCSTTLGSTVKVVISYRMFRTRSEDIRLSCFCFVFCKYIFFKFYIFEDLVNGHVYFVIASPHFRKLTLIEIIKHWWNFSSNIHVLVVSYKDKCGIFI